ncbi:MAG: helix-turn-helix transcriptional regulator [Pseudomonadota bacterium]
MSGIGTRIRDARKRKGWRQEDLAAEVGCSQQTIVDIEGQEDPKSRFLSAIVLALGETMEWIMWGVGAPHGRGEVDSTALPHYDLEAAALQALEPALVESEIDALYSPPVHMSRVAYTVGVDRSTAEAMDQQVRQGDVLFVDPALEPEYGRLALVVMPGWDRAELRVLENVNGRRFFTMDSEAFGERRIAVAPYRTLDEYRAHEGDLPPGLIVGVVVFVGRDV